ncbi:MAG: hypothetical protein CMD81_10305 [Gammaproteobacteria bacterium]|nr:hypothetical protein [Gammaproteobacteria bacterium]HBF09405.1 hypothetical protein [Gammaproteobacteria bacterium]|tara:strand:+ start:5287 stop:7185 length:1899 start_codon:yes stop_codon:yes gene_type:complete
MAQSVVSQHRAIQNHNSNNFINPNDASVLSNIASSSNQVDSITENLELTNINETSNTSYLLNEQPSTHEVADIDAELNEALKRVKLSPNAEAVFNILRDVVENPSNNSDEFNDYCQLHYDILVSMIMSPDIDVNQVDALDNEYNSVLVELEALEAKMAIQKQLQSQLKPYSTSEDLKVLGYNQLNLEDHETIDGLSIMFKGGAQGEVGTVCFVVDENFEMPEDDTPVHEHLLSVLKDSNSKKINDFIQKNEKKLDTILFVHNAVEVSASTGDDNKSHQLITMPMPAPYGNQRDMRIQPPRPTYQPPRTTNVVTTKAQPTARYQQYTQQKTGVLGGAYKRTPAENLKKYNPVNQRPVQGSTQLRGIGARMNRVQVGLTSGIASTARKWNDIQKSTVSYSQKFTSTQPQLRQQQQSLANLSKNARLAAVQPSTTLKNGLTSQSLKGSYNPNLKRELRSIPPKVLPAFNPSITKIQDVHKENLRLQGIANDMRVRARAINNVRLQLAQQTKLVEAAKARLQQEKLKAKVPESFTRHENWAKNAPNVLPGANRLDFYKYNKDTCNYEYSRVIYDKFGRQTYRVDKTDHGRRNGNGHPNDEGHTDPHLHITTYAAKGAQGYDDKTGSKTEKFNLKDY